ncbi:MAG: proton-conducting transporter membrane subunit [Bacteroides sp.]|jgi:multicomponent Na+:H+ antiporter subunit D|nr:proton-conducting transporter membrane subunit [Bacteroides sp.]
MSAFIPLFVILPLAGAFVIPVFTGYWKNMGKVLTPTLMLVLLALSVMFFFRDSAVFVYYVGGWELINGVPVGIQFVVDGLSVLMLSIINMVAFFASFFSISYLKKFTGDKYFYALFCLMVAGMNGVVITGDLFNLFIFLEIAVIASYALVAFGIEREELEASFKYQVLGGLASLLVLLGIVVLYWKTGSLNIADISWVLKQEGSSPSLLFIQILFIAGFGLKAAMIPFHAWLPDAHSSAPAPISAMLSGVLIKAVGVYAIMRLFFNMFELTYEMSMLILVIGTISMVGGVFLAIGQWDFKRLLAYHSISQMGYVFLGLGMGMVILSVNGNKAVAIMAIAGGLYHMVNHAVFKSLLFLNSGAVEYKTGTRMLKELGGLSENMPLTSTSSFGASMAISGIPPFNGFFSKLLIIIAAVQGQFYLMAALAVLVSIITLASFMKVHRYAFSGNFRYRDMKKFGEAPFSMLFSMLVMAGLCLLLSLLIIPVFRDIFLTPAVNDLINLLNYSQPIIGY